MENILLKLSDIVRGVPLLILLMGTLLFLTFRLRFIHKYIPKAIRLSFKRKKEGKGDVSQFGALMTALAATIGLDFGGRDYSTVIYSFKKIEAELQVDDILRKRIEAIEEQLKTLL